MAPFSSAVNDLSPRRTWRVPSSTGARSYLIPSRPSFTGLVALALFFSLRSYREFLYLALYALANSAFHLALLLSWVTPFDVPSTIRLFLLNSASLIAFIEFIRQLLGRRRTWLILLLELLAVIGPATGVSWALGYTSSLVSAASDVATLLIYLTVIVLLYLGAKRRSINTPNSATLAVDARILLVSLLPAVYACVSDILHTLDVSFAPGIPNNLHLGPLVIVLDAAAGVILELALLLFLVTRTVRIAQDRNRIASEFEAARSLQHLLIPDELPQIPGLTIATAYHPAQEVGGDFFQIVTLPTRDTLILLGDVAGKGLAAAMTVSLLVGAIRTLAEHTQSPAEILAGLNRRLLNRGSGFTTCLILRISPAGTLTLANAGHIPPYLNGHELPTIPSLPLGLDPDAAFKDQSHRLTPPTTTSPSLPTAFPKPSPATNSSALPRTEAHQSRARLHNRASRPSLRTDRRHYRPLRHLRHSLKQRTAPPPHPTLLYAASPPLLNHPDCPPSHQLLHPINKQSIRRHGNLPRLQHRAELPRLLKIEQHLCPTRRVRKQPHQLRQHRRIG